MNEATPTQEETMAKDFDKLVWDLENERWKVRQDAVKSLGGLGDARTVEPLIAALKDENSDVRISAVEALAQIGMPAVQPLIETLGSSDWYQCQGASSALVKIGDVAVESLIAALDRGDSDHQRARVAKILGKLQDLRAIGPLILALEDADSFAHGAIAAALGQFQSHTSVIDLQRRMHNECSKRRKPLILVVEDDWDLGLLLKSILRHEGMDVAITTGGAEGLFASWILCPDLVSLDIMMPDLDGFEVCRRLQEMSDVPIIFLSAKGLETDIMRGLEMGADDYVTKPFSTQELVSRIKAVLHRTETSATNSSHPYSDGELAKELEAMPPHSEETTTLLQKEIKRLRRQRTELLQRIEALEKRGTPSILGLVKSIIGRRHFESFEERGIPSEAGTIPISELGHLVSGIVHDLRGGLGVIRNIAGFMLDDVGSDRSLATDLRKIVQSAEFCEVVIRNLIALGGGEVFEPTEVNIERVVREVFFMLERKLVDVALVVDADPATPTIMADEGQMKQVFMNLIKNAGEAMPDGGTLTVRTRREGRMLRIEVSDTGCGISPENQERLFHEFFTTKDRGYGLGLHIVNTIVKRHGGAIGVESKVGEGTTFTLHLPIESE